MATLVVTSPLAGDGKSTVAAGLADALAGRGHRVHLAADGPAAGTAASPDAAPPGADSSIREHADPATAAAAASAAVLLVAREGQADDATLERAARESGAAAIVLSSVPERAEETARNRVQAIAARLNGMTPLVGLLPQDRLLAAPSLAQMAAALEGALTAPEGAGDEAVEWIEVGPITAHPGSVHFATEGSKAIVTRSDRPDVALTALDADVHCLILCGDREPLRYVLERTEADEVPLITTALTTAEAVERLGPLYGRGEFRGARKRERARRLVERFLDLEAMERLLQLGASTSV